MGANILNKTNILNKMMALNWHFVARFLRSFFSFQQYLFTLLLSLHYKTMICSPLQFKDYVIPAKIAGRIFYVALLSLLFSLEHAVYPLAGIATNQSQFDIDHSNRKSFKFNWLKITEIWDVVKYSMFCVIFTVKMVLTSASIRAALGQSDRMNNGRSTSSSSFIPICVIPTVNGFVCLVLQILSAAMHLYEKDNPDLCLLELFVYRVHLPLKSAVCAAGSLTQCFGYLFCFPALRKDLTDIASKIKGRFVKL